MNLKCNLIPEVKKYLPSRTCDNVYKTFSKLPVAVQKIYICSICGKYFTSAVHMKMHNYTHSRPNNIRFISESNIPLLSVDNYKVPPQNPGKNLNSVLIEAKSEEKKQNDNANALPDNLGDTEVPSNVYQSLKHDVNINNNNALKESSIEIGSVNDNISTKSLSPEVHETCQANCIYPDEDEHFNDIFTEARKENDCQNRNVVITSSKDINVAENSSHLKQLDTNANKIPYIHTSVKSSAEIKSSNENSSISCRPPEKHEFEPFTQRVTSFKYRYKCTKCAHYVCKVCNKSYKARAYFKAHTDLHTGLAHYLCEKCGMAFPKMREFKKHSKAEHTGMDIQVPCRKIYRQCDLCSKYFSSCLEYEQHYFSHLSHPKYSCDRCALQFISEENLINHKIIEHNNDCPIPNSVSDINSENCICEVCKLECTDANELRVHLSNHVNYPLKDFFCDVCKQTFVNNDELQSHYLQHVNELYQLHDVIGIHSCTSCNQKFLSEEELKSHICSEKSMECSTLTPNPQILSSEAFSEISNNTIDNELEKQNANTSEVISSSVCDKGTSKNVGVPDVLQNCDDNMDAQEIIITAVDSLSSTTTAGVLQVLENSIDDYMDIQEVINVTTVHDKLFSTTNQNISENSESNFTFNMDPSMPKSSGGAELPINDPIKEKFALDENMKVVSATDANEISQIYQVLDVDKKEESSRIHIIYLKNSFHSPANKEKAFIKKSTDHQKLSNKSETHVCHICDDIFTTRNSLFHHIYQAHAGFDCKKMLMKKEVKEKKFKCNMCKKSFDLKGNLKNHIIRKHEKCSDSGSYFCNVCHKTFFKKSDFNLHHASHEDFKCEVCGKVYKIKWLYKKHLLSHSGQINILKPYKCSICDNRFCSRAHLWNHTSSHLKRNSQNSECRICHMFFKNVSLLAKHMLSHSVYH